jgi:hypothetical protein|nr:MAG TPA: hypothetical protein [Caudoviricetes sp.]
MTKKQCITIDIISAILTAVFLYAVCYFPHLVAECMFWFVSAAFCFGCFYLLIAIIWTKGEILPNPYPNYYLPDPDIYLGEIKKESKKNG